MKESGRSSQNRRILTVSLSGEQRYSLRKESAEEQWMRQSRKTKTYGSLWMPFKTVVKGEIRQFAGFSYQCAHSHLMMPGYEPDRTPVLWKRMD